jgi:hypothetical protein
VLTFQAFRFELDPNNQTRSSLASHAGAARVAHNVMLGYLHYCLDRRGWERRTLGATVSFSCRPQIPPWAFTDENNA